MGGVFHYPQIGPKMIGLLLGSPDYLYVIYSKVYSNISLEIDWLVVWNIFYVSIYWE